MSKVIGLFLYEKKGSTPKTVDEAEADAAGGILGDHHGARPGREILVVDRAVLDDHGIEPGALREQVTVDVPELNSLQPGAFIAAGDAVLEVMEECKPCLIIAEYNGAEDAEAFRDSTKGRRGVFVKVADDGDKTLRVGDPISVI